MTRRAPSLADLVTASREAECEEQHAATMLLIDSVSALETLTEDVLTIIAAEIPATIEGLRDVSAAKAQQIDDGRATTDDMRLGGFYLRRLSILRAALERVGRPYQGAEVVVLNAVRASSAMAAADKQRE